MAQVEKRGFLASRIRSLIGGFDVVHCKYFENTTYQ